MTGLAPAFRRLLRDDRGAVTVDWVSLTAGILLVGLAVVYAIFRNMEPVVDEVNATMANMPLNVDPGDSPTFTD
jgi:hypothetical protein